MWRAAGARRDVSQWCNRFGAVELAPRLAERFDWLTPPLVLVAILFLLPEQPPRPKRRASRVRVGATRPSA